MPLRLIFMGTPDFAVPTLKKIVERRYDVAAVYTRAPKPAGRGMAPTSSPVESVAREHGLRVLTPTSLRTPEAEAEFRGHQADVAVVVAYGLILPKPILDAPRLGCFNVHASLLPRWRGAAPIHRAIMAGDLKTGVRVMKMDETLDTGRIAGRATIRIKQDATTGDLHELLKELGADLMMGTLNRLNLGLRLTLKRQPEEVATYANKIDRNETRIVWELPWHEVHNRIRGLSPFPGAWFEFTLDGKPVRIKVLRTTEGKGSGPAGTLIDDQLTIACREGSVRIVELQRAGGKAMKAEEFLRGLPLKPGTRLG